MKMHTGRFLALAVITAMLLPRASVCAAANPTLERLQAELRQAFPAPVAKITGQPPEAARSPYSIAKKEYLFAWPANILSSTQALSFIRLRSYPDPLRQAHAACVKVVTPWWHGAGVLISREGDVLTSYHLVAGVPSLKIQTLDGQFQTVTNIVRCSPVHDLAVVRIPGGPYAFLSPTNAADPAAGTPLYILGHPEDFTWKLSVGKTIRTTADCGTDVLHFDSDISRGNSGGPVLDAEGRLCAITACAAELADGSKVKVGISQRAIRSFLGSPANAPVPLNELAVREQNRQAADFLSLVSVLVADFLDTWATSMAALSLESASSDGPVPTQGTNGSSDATGIRFTNTKQGVETAARILVLRLFVVRCGTTRNLDPHLRAATADLLDSLDRLLDCTAMLSRPRPQQPAAVLEVIARAKTHRESAEKGFGRALQDIQLSCREFDFQISDPRRFETMASLSSRYTPSGCHVRQPSQGQ